MVKYYLYKMINQPSLMLLVYLLILAVFYVFLIYEENTLHPIDLPIEEIAKQAHVILHEITKNPNTITLIIESDYSQLVQFIKLLTTRPDFLLIELETKKEAGLISTWMHLDSLTAREHA